MRSAWGVTWNVANCIRHDSPHVAHIAHKTTIVTVLVISLPTGVETKLKNAHYPVIIAASSIQELTCVTKTPEGILFGSATTLTRLEQVLKEAIVNLPGKIVTVENC